MIFHSRQTSFLFGLLPLTAVLVISSPSEAQQTEKGKAPKNHVELVKDDGLPLRILKLIEKDPHKAALAALSSGPGFKAYKQFLRHQFKKDPKLTLEIFALNFEQMNEFYLNAYEGFEGATLEQIRELEKLLPKHFKNDQLKKMRGVLHALHARIDPNAALTAMEKAADYEVTTYLVEPIVKDLARGDRRQAVLLSEKVSGSFS